MGTACVAFFVIVVGLRVGDVALTTDLASGFAAFVDVFFATGLGAGFFATGLGASFFAAGFLGCGFTATFFTGVFSSAFFAGNFFAAALATGFFANATGFFAVGFAFAATGFFTGFFVAMMRHPHAGCLNNWPTMHINHVNSSTHAVLAPIIAV
ncbi:MAG: hypothetical protein V4735_02320 [Pseudomonadota bacterium]